MELDATENALGVIDPKMKLLVPLWVCLYTRSEAILDHESAFSIGLCPLTEFAITVPRADRSRVAAGHFGLESGFFERVGRRPELRGGGWISSAHFPESMFSY